LEAAQALLPDEDIGRQERGILSRSDSQTLKQALAVADEIGLVAPSVRRRQNVAAKMIISSSFGPTPAG